MCIVEEDKYIMHYTYKSMPPENGILCCEHCIPIPFSVTIRRKNGVRSIPPKLR